MSGPKRLFNSATAWSRLFTSTALRPATGSLPKLPSGAVKEATMRVMGGVMKSRAAAGTMVFFTLTIRLRWNIS